MFIQWSLNGDRLAEEVGSKESSENILCDDDSTIISYVGREHLNIVHLSRKLG